MAKQEVLIGQTDYTVLIHIPDPASTDGSGKTGLVAANLTVSGSRVETDNDVTVTDYTSSLNNLAALTTAHTDWGLLEVSSTLAPGLYRLDIADAIFASGAWSAVVYVMITSSAAAATPMEFILVPTAPINGVNTYAVGGTTQTAGDIIGDTNDIQARLPAALTGDGNIKADTLRVGGTLQTAGDIMADTNDIQTRLPAALVGGRMDSSVGAMAANVMTAAATAADYVTELQSGLATAAALATTDGKIDTIDGIVDSILADTGTDGVVIAAATMTAIADALLNRDMATGTDSGSTTVRTVRQALRALRNKVSVAAGTMTVTKEDDSTSSWTAAVSTDAAAEPIVSVDPAGP